MRPTYHEHELFQRAPVLTDVYRLTQDVESHGHDFCEIAIIGTGAGAHVSTHGEHAVSHGDVFVLRPGAWHGFTGCRNLTVANCCVSASPPPASGLALLRELAPVRDLLWLGPHRATARGVLSTRVEPDRADAAIAEITEIASLRADPARTSVVHPVALLGRLLTVLGNLVGGGSTDPPAHPAVTAVTELLESTPERQWRVDELARRANLDAAYLSRLFRRDTGLSPIEYLARVRAERAAMLLTRTGEPVSRVGRRVGWADPTYFARRFHALVGLTPTEYRRRSGTTRTTR